MKWITPKWGTFSRPEHMGTKVPRGMKEALKRYAKSEGVQVTDIINTKLMADPKLRKILAEVQKEPHDNQADQDN